MSKNKVIKRGELYFLLKDEDIIEIYIGEPDNPESEFFATFHKSFIDNIIAGLSEIKFNK